MASDDAQINFTNKSTHSLVVVGGGIAGVTCAEQLSLECPDEEILLISASPLIKAVTNFKQVSRAVEVFDVEEKPFVELETKCPNVCVIQAAVVHLNSEKQELFLSTKQVIVYKKLCICAGGRPKVIAKDCPCVFGIRDTETIQVFQQKIADANRILVVGNGGIATELVYEIEQCQVIWAIKHKSIGATFFDAGAAEFFLPHLKQDKGKDEPVVKRTKYTLGDGVHSKSHLGSALGPDWASGIAMKGRGQNSHDVHVEHNCEVREIYSPQDFCQKNIKVTEIKGNDMKACWPVYVELTNGSVYGCDLIISATGVEPNIEPFVSENKFEVAEDGGLKVDDQMRTTVKHVYAAGDICTASWPIAKHWIQMRLWTQARQMGAYAAKTIAAHLRGEEVAQDICFDLFTHSTRFFGFKVVLLGLFNGQGLGKDYEILLRVTKGQEYVKVILQEGQMQGAILIGETDLEETFENLILNQMDLSSYGEELLNPDIDIEDYFD